MLCFLLAEKTEYLLNQTIPEYEDYLNFHLPYSVDKAIYQYQSILEGVHFLLAEKIVKLKKKEQTLELIVV